MKDSTSKKKEGGAFQLARRVNYLIFSIISSIFIITAITTVGVAEAQGLSLTTVMCLIALAAVTYAQDQAIKLLEEPRRLCWERLCWERLCWDDPDQ